MNDLIFREFQIITGSLRNFQLNKFDKYKKFVFNQGLTPESLVKKGEFLNIFLGN